MQDNEIVITAEAVEGPVIQGRPAVTTIRIENDGPDVLLLDGAATGGRWDGEVLWNRHPLGIVVYDAARDRYRHRTGPNATAVVPIATGLVPPGGACEALLTLKELALGPRQARVAVRGRRFPPGELAARVYRPPETLGGAVVTYERAGDGAPFPGGGVIVRTHGAAPLELEVSVAYEVTSDADAPAEAALEAAGPGSELFDRSRSLGGAWIVRDAARRFHAVQAERHVRCGAVDAGVWARLDRDPPFEPVRIVFRGPDAAALRDAGLVRILGLERGQQLVDRADLWSLLEACAERGLEISHERHANVSAGLVVR